MSSRRSARNKTVSSLVTGVDAPATVTEQENKSPANTNIIDNGMEAVAESNQGSESEIQCGICFDDIACRGVIDSCEHTYCFTCIHSWSKVTNLCPFCKQRFTSIQKKTLKGPPPKDENKKFKIKNKTQQQPDNFDIRDFISSEEEYDMSFDDDEDPEDGEYRGRNGLTADVRSQIQLLARNYQRRGFNVNIELLQRDPTHVIIDDEGASDEEVVTIGQGSRGHPRAGAGSNRARANNNNRRRRAMEEAENEMADFIVPDDDWEMQSTELAYDSEELSDEEIATDEPRRPAQKRRRPAANNSRATGRNNNSRVQPRAGARNNNGSVPRAPKRAVSRVNSNVSSTPIAIDDDIPFIDATGNDIQLPNSVTMSQEDALAIALALQENENEGMHDERRISYDSEDDEITLRSRRKVRRTN